jgi:guanylate kinase
MPREGILFILVGPSGAGKTTLLQRVQHQFDNLTQLATMTTRGIRDGEVEGREHWYISHAEFLKMIEENALVEWQQVHLKDLYGTPRKTVEDAIHGEHDLIADIEFLGAGKVRADYPNNTVLIFVTPSSLDILTERILRRGNITPEALTNRLERAKFEMTFAPRCDYVLLNDDIDEVSAQLFDIIQAERDLNHTNRHTIHTTVTALIRYGDQLLLRDGKQIPTLQIDEEVQHQLPHEALQARLQHELGCCAITIESLSDSRFDFIAPNHIEITAAPPEITVQYYYKCSLSERIIIPGWEWCPLTSLNLPATIGGLVLSS